MPFIKTNRGNFFYHEKEGDHPTLLFLHGNLGSANWWREVMSSLPFSWRGIAYDAMGFGQSPRPEGLERYSVPARLRDLIAIIDVLALKHIHLVAHSTSTPVAMEYALLAPDQVASLTLIGPVPATGVQTPPEAYPLLERMSTDRELLAEALHASAPHLDRNSAQFQAYLKDAASIPPLALSAIARGLDAWRPGDRLRQLTMPVMLVRGQDDIMLEEKEAHATLISIPGAISLENLHGAGHSPMIENPQGLAEIIVSFIKDIEQA